MIKGIFLTACIFIASCATPSNEADFKKLSPMQRLYVGRIKVNVNGLPGEKCELYMNGDLVASVKIADDGYLIYRTEGRKPGLQKVTCFHKLNQYKAAWHSVDLDLKPFSRPEDQSNISYFGDVTLDWKMDTSLTESAEILDGSQGPMKIGSVKNSGEIKVLIEDKLADIDAYAKANWKITADRKIVSALTAKVD